MVSSTCGHTHLEIKFQHGCEGRLCGLVAIALVLKDNDDAGANVDAGDADNSSSYVLSPYCVPVPVPSTSTILLHAVLKIPPLR